MHNEEDELIYVGQTDQDYGSPKGLRDRLGQHKRYKVEWNGKNYAIDYDDVGNLTRDASLFYSFCNLNAH